MKISSIAAIICSGLLLNALIRQPPGSAHARSKPPQIESGLLAELRAGRSVMFVGAHPDDETTLGPLLARASEQTKVIVVCFTKGEGGPNKIGPELDAMLGEIRVKELAAAARVLGVEHRILGFWNGLPGGMRNPENPRETPEQAIARWRQSGRDPMGELVKAIRQWRPDIIISFDPEQGFTGHKEHRAVGMLTASAFQEAADTGRYAEQLKEGLKAWQTRRFYQVVNLYPDNPRLPRIDGQRITEVIDGNLRSPKRDKTYAEIGLEAFASHPSQVGQDLAQPAFAARIRRQIEQTAVILAASEPKTAGDDKTQPLQPRDYSIPLIDLAGEKQRQVLVDREPGQYLGHPTTVLLEDGKTIIAVYPKGHGRGAIQMKRSIDGGLTWSERLPTPKTWETSLETPTIHRVIDARGRKRLIVFSGLYPIRMSVSENDGKTWSELKPIGDGVNHFGGIVAMGFVEALKTGQGHYLAMFHDDGRFFRKDGTKTPVMTLYQTISKDGGLTWSEPQEIFKSDQIHLCEPGLIRSPDGKQLAVLLRENKRDRNSHVIFSDDEAQTWMAPRELPGALTGDRHTGKYAPDGRLFISFRDTTQESPTKGDWVAWVGRYEDIVKGREGQYRVRLMDNHKNDKGWDADCAYPGVEVLGDGTFVTTTYGHWIEGQTPYVVSVRLTLKELDRKASR